MSTGLERVDVGGSAAPTPDSRAVRRLGSSWSLKAAALADDSAKDPDTAVWTGQKSAKRQPESRCHLAWDRGNIHSGEPPRMSAGCAGHPRVSNCELMDGWH